MEELLHFSKGVDDHIRICDYDFVRLIVAAPEDLEIRLVAAVERISELHIFSEL